MSEKHTTDNRIEVMVMMIIVIIIASQSCCLLTPPDAAEDLVAFPVSNNRLGLGLARASARAEIIILYHTFAVNVQVHNFHR